MWQTKMCCADLQSRKDLLPTCRTVPVVSLSGDSRAGTAVRRGRCQGHRIEGGAGSQGDANAAFHPVSWSPPSLLCSPGLAGRWWSTAEGLGPGHFYPAQSGPLSWAVFALEFPVGLVEKGQVCPILLLPIS